jgi:hypothetical protein
METHLLFTSYLAQLLLEWEMFGAKLIQNIITHFMFNNVFRISL